MKVYFVGLHNKTGKMPLCSSTKTGKLIDRIITDLAKEGFWGEECTWQKTNLFDTDYLPRTDFEKIELADGWAERINPQEGDIAVLLGGMVHKFFREWIGLSMVKVAHPASKRSHEAMNDYVEYVASCIKYEALPDTRCLHCGRTVKSLSYSGYCSRCSRVLSTIYED